MRAAVALALATGLSPLACDASCFQIVDPQERVVYQSSASPIDLSLPISEAMGRDFPGHHLTVIEGACIAFIGDDAVGDDDDFGIGGIYAAAQAVAAPGSVLARPVPVGVAGSHRAYASRHYQPGRDVQVRAYIRANGTRVQAYTRSRPGQGQGRATHK